MGVVRHWHKLTRGMVGIPCVEPFMARLGQTLCNLIYLWMSLFIDRDLDYMTFYVPYKLEELNHSIIL